MPLAVSKLAGSWAVAPVPNFNDSAGNAIKSISAVASVA